MPRFDLETDRDTWRAELDRADWYDVPAEFAEDSAPHVCDERCREWCESFSAAIKKYARGAA